MAKEENSKTPKDAIEEYIKSKKNIKEEDTNEELIEKINELDLGNLDDSVPGEGSDVENGGTTSNLEKGDSEGESSTETPVNSPDKPVGPSDDDTVYFKFNTTSHKMEGKHSLKRDTIFHGKVAEEVEEDYMYTSDSDYYNKDFPIERGTTFEMESRNHEELQTQRQLKGDIYELLSKNTDLDFTSNRRKPNKQAFNTYYEMLLKSLNNKYTKSEIFVELSYYFTDHIFNMYKLLYPQHATNIIMELRDKGYLNELDDMIFV